MTVAATSNLAKTVEALRTTLSETAAWQTWTGEANATLAKAHIYIGHVPTADMTSNLPVALIKTPDDRTVGGEGTEAVTRGSLMLVFYAGLVGGSTTIEDERLTFMNDVGSTVDDLLATSRSGTAEFLHIRSIAAQGEETLPDPADAPVGQTIRQEFAVAWGLTGPT